MREQPVSNRMSVTLPKGNLDTYSDVSGDTKVVDGTLIVYTEKSTHFYATGQWLKAVYTKSNES